MLLLTDSVMFYVGYKSYFKVVIGDSGRGVKEEKRMEGFWK